MKAQSVSGGGLEVVTETQHRSSDGRKHLDIQMAPSVGTPTALAFRTCGASVQFFPVPLCIFVHL